MKSPQPMLSRRSPHPNLVLGAVSFVLLFVGIVLRANDIMAGSYLILGAFIIGGIHWIWGMTDVFRNRELLPNSRIFWMVVVLLVPPVGGMLYYLMRSKNVRM